MKLHEASNVKATWIEGRETSLYEAVPGTLKGNAKASSLRFTLRNLHASGDTFEVLIHKFEGGPDYAYRADCFDDSDDYDIAMYRSPEGLVFFAETGYGGHVYFRVE